MGKYSICYSLTNQRKEANDLLEYRMFFIARNLIILLPITVIGMLFAISNVEKGQLFTSWRGRITLVYFVVVLLGLVVFPWIKLLWDVKKIYKGPKEIMDIHVIFYEDYIAIQYQKNLRRIYYCDIVRVIHNSKFKYWEVTGSLNSDLKSFYQTHPLGGYSMKIPFSDLKEELLCEIENYLKSKGKAVKYV